MNRQRSPHRAAASLVASSNGSPAAHPPIWHRGPDLLTFGSTGAAILGFCFVVLGLLPGLVLMILLLLGFEAMQGEPSSDESGLTMSTLILGLIGCVVLMGLVFAWVFSAARVLAFTFDENQQLLTLTVTRRGRKPTEVQVPFDDIICICPYVLASYDRDGYFSVVCQGPRDKEFVYRLAEGTSLEDMEFHAAWLRGIIGVRMQELLNMDK
ncbi:MULTISPECIES: ABC transporter permease [Pseudomonas]|jgi:hypothetical protein|uniref:Transmembrane protein n=2 Tax=Pseudomonas TaxID=286 RepID=A0A4Y9TE83_PSEFL|nr:MULTISPECIES: ABC transporter permease [Pseudomonas]CRM94994.1 hypothetical protein [Pseudomonas sp. 22 E 5]MCX9152587.1 ABC transporter permease [Pseudomonas sp. TB1-B1]QXH65412.1 ABC transporter permease [Pseudomonas asgharzadehiana]TFW41382.1 hypothetical protein E4T65_22065 [Pseudomonas fluorescens]TKJ65366.1 hypothetical protein PspCFBP13506_00865 [Pseudomonas sp. CFBP13506]